MTQGLFTLGLLAIIIALFAGVIRQRWYLAEAIIAFLFGVLVGPVGLEWFTPEWSGKDGSTLELIARIIVALTVMEITLRLPPGYPLRCWRSLAGILGGVMPLMALISGALILLFTDLPFWVAMLIGAITIPTDPIIASAILNGSFAKKSLTARTRRVLSAETGANDGAAYPLILLCILMVNLPAGEAIVQWVGWVVLWQVGGGILLGVVLGRAAAYLRGWAEEKGGIEPETFFSYTVALTLLLLAVSTWMKLDGFVVVFTVGTVYRLQRGNVKLEHSFQQGLSSFLMFPVFALIGAVIPWSAWGDLGWKGAVLALLVILLRRLPALALLKRWIPALKEKRDTLFVGWFGPIGVDTFFFAMLAVGRTGREEVWEVGSLLLVASLFAHGWTATPFTRLYRR